MIDGGIEMIRNSASLFKGLRVSKFDFRACLGLQFANERIDIMTSTSQSSNAIFKVIETVPHHFQRLHVCHYFGDGDRHDGLIRN
jgi:hypothetical protein